MFAEAIAPSARCGWRSEPTAISLRHAQVLLFIHPCLPSAYPNPPHPKVNELYSINTSQSNRSDVPLILIRRLARLSTTLLGVCWGSERSHDEALQGKLRVRTAESFDDDEISHWENICILDNGRLPSMLPIRKADSPTSYFLGLARRAFIARVGPLELF
jgi:hypothetical protein